MKWSTQKQLQQKYLNIKVKDAMKQLSNGERKMSPYHINGLLDYTLAWYHNATPRCYLYLSENKIYDFLIIKNIICIYTCQWFICISLSTKSVIRHVVYDAGFLMEHKALSFSTNFPKSNGDKIWRFPPLAYEHNNDRLHRPHHTPHVIPLLLLLALLHPPKAAGLEITVRSGKVPPPQRRSVRDSLRTTPFHVSFCVFMLNMLIN